MKFHFRLDRVLRYRADEEEQAKRQLRLAQAARVAAESALDALMDKYRQASEHGFNSIHGALQRETYKGHLQLEMELQNRVILELIDEEMAALGAWKQKRQDLRTLELMRDSAHAEWQLEESRREQRELDEWAVLRRAA